MHERYAQETYRRTLPYLKSHIAIGEVETFVLLPTDGLLIGSTLGHWIWHDCCMIVILQPQTVFQSEL